MQKNRYEALLTFLFLLSAFFLALCKLEDTDAWTHLNFGRLIFELKGLPAHEPFTYPSFDRPAAYYSWLFGLVFYLAYSALNVYGVILLKAIIVAAAFFVLLRDSLRPWGNTLVSLAVLTLVALMARHRFVERPDIVFMLFLPLSILALNAYVYENKKYIYWLPLVHLLWANAHASIIFMIIPFGAFIGGGLIQRLLDRKGSLFNPALTDRQIMTLFVVFLLSFAVSLLNPHGIAQYTDAFAVVNVDWWKDEITELGPPTWETFKSVYFFAAALLLSFMLDWLTAHKLRRSRSDMRYPSLIHFILAIPFLFFALTTFRFIFLLGVVGGPLMARNLSAVLERVRTQDLRLSTVFTGRYRAPVLAVWIVLSTSLTIADVEPFGDDGKVFGLGVHYDSLPEKALRYMDKRAITGNVFNLFQWGGYITWRDFPGRKAFVDGRGYLSPDLLEKIKTAPVKSSLLDTLSRTYDFEVILLSYPTLETNVPEAFAAGDIVVSSPGWALVYWDDLALLYLKRGGRYASVIEQDEYRLVKPATILYNKTLLQDERYQPGLISELQRNIDESGSSRAQVVLGALYNTMGRHREALEAFSRVDMKTPWLLDLKSACNGMGFAHFALGDMDAAIRNYKKSLTYGDDADVYYNIGAAFVGKGDERKALRYFERALDVNPGLTAAYTGLVGIYRKFGMNDRIVRAEKAYQAAQMDDKGKDHFQAAMKAYFGKRYQDAVQEFNKSIEANPSNPVAYSNLGFIYYDIHDMGRAYEYQKKAVEIDPNYANAHYGLALIYKRAGDAENAGKHWQEYLRLEPTGHYSRKAKEELKLLDRR